MRNFCKKNYVVLEFSLLMWPYSYSLLLVVVFSMCSSFLKKKVDCRKSRKFELEKFSVSFNCLGMNA